MAGFVLLFLAVCLYASVTEGAAMNVISWLIIVFPQIIKQAAVFWEELEPPFGTGIQNSRYLCNYRNCHGDSFVLITQNPCLI